MVFGQSSGTLNLFQSAFSDGQGKSISQLIAVRFSVQVIAHLPTTQEAPISQISKENRKKLTLLLAPSTRFERVAFRLGVRRTGFWSSHAFPADTRQSLLPQGVAGFYLLNDTFL